MNKRLVKKATDNLGFRPGVWINQTCPPSRSRPDQITSRHPGRFDNFFTPPRVCVFEIGGMGLSSSSDLPGCLVIDLSIGGYSPTLEYLPSPMGGGTGANLRTPLVSFNPNAAALRIHKRAVAASRTDKENHADQRVYGSCGKHEKSLQGGILEGSPKIGYRHRIDAPFGRTFTQNRCGREGVCTGIGKREGNDILRSGFMKTHKTKQEVPC